MPGPSDVDGERVGASASGRDRPCPDEVDAVERRPVGAARARPGAERLEARDPERHARRVAPCGDERAPARGQDGRERAGRPCDEDERDEYLDERVARVVGQPRRTRPRWLTTMRRLRGPAARAMVALSAVPSAPKVMRERAGRAANATPVGSA